jgi:hypothetical protein
MPYVVLAATRDVSLRQPSKVKCRSDRIGADDHEVITGDNIAIAWHVAVLASRVDIVTR